MKKTLLLSLSLLTTSALASVELNCGNPPKTKWGTYTAFIATVNSPTSLKVTYFGTMEGSDAAQEAEPVDVFLDEEEILKHDSSAAATSKEWRNALSFPVGSNTTIFVPKEVMAGKVEFGNVRIKSSDGKGNVVIPCRVTNK